MKGGYMPWGIYFMFYVRNMCDRFQIMHDGFV